MNVDNLTTIIEELKTLRSTLMEQSQSALKVMFEEFLKAHPQCKTVVWTQYTPYFNDGEECVFRVGAPEFSPIAAKDMESYHDIEDYENESERPLELHETYERNKYVEKPDPKAFRGYTYVVEGTEVVEADSRTTPQLRKDANALSEILQNEDMEDAMRTAFGNHVWVKAYLKRDKVAFDVEDYEHE